MFHSLLSLLNLKPLGLLTCFAFLISNLGFAAERPNIIIIMADDMGYSDIGCYGGEIKTPNLDSLAANGMRFTQFYNTSRCCPTRASLLTGLYPHQAGIGHMTGDYGLPQYQGYLNQECLTIAEALKPTGYRTYMSGKWHVTPKVKASDPKDNWPRQRGFDKFFGTIHGAGSLFDPNSLTRDNTQITPENDPEYKPKGTWYYTDAISDNTVRYIDSHFKEHPDKPFFHYVAYTSAHWPMHALPEDIAKYEGKYDDGYAPVYQARLKKMKELGLLDPKWEIPGPIGDWSKVELKEWESACMEVYAAMVDNMDQGIGRIVQKLKDHDQLDNTLIFYLQDNGGCAESFGRGKLVGPLKRPAAPTLKPMGKDELQTNMVPAQSRDGYPLRRGKGVMPGPAETEIGYGENWANVSNTPFREYKHWVHEGGISTPLIAHWPEGINGKNTWAKDPTHLIDLMATCLDLAKATYPSTMIPVEGTSLVPALKGESIKRGKPIYFEHEGNRAVREGAWKLVAKGVNSPWELYHIPADRTEMNNLAEKHPDRVKTMSAQYETWAKERGVVPFGSWRKNKNKKSKTSGKKIFNLKPGDTFTPETSPNIANRPFTITAQLESFPATGVIAAQGGSSHGWSLYLKDKQIHFTVRQGGKKVTASMTLRKNPSGYFQAHIRKDGIRLDSAASPHHAQFFESNALLTAQPIDVLELGQDSSGLVGDYKKDFKLSVPLKSLTISLK
ncbi:MAG: arylsulfatase [Akkermansiaceae bacterium]|jgi:arylsulfatase